MPSTNFSFKKFTVQQDRSSFKVTTDSCILGASVNIPPPGYICDIGTGTGIIALMLAQKYPGSIIDAVEIDPESAVQAGANFRQSPWNSRLRVYPDSIQKFIKGRPNTYDLIISNPPYFENQKKSSDLRKARTRHNLKLSYEELIAGSKSLIKSDGWFYIILPEAFFNQFFNKIKVYGFHLVDKLEIRSFQERSAHRIIGGFRLSHYKMRVRKLCIHTKTGQYTASFRSLLKDYYLAF